MVKRAASMLSRISSSGPIVFSGGVAHNPCIVKMVADHLKREVLIPEDPHMTGALGAALILEKQLAAPKD